jgi:F-type H+-transporting ATPase subunit b
MMKRAKYSVVFTIVLLLVLLSSNLYAQEQAAPEHSTPVAAQGANPSEHQPTQGTEKRSEERGASQGGIGAELAEASREAAGEEEENAQFKQSPSVRMIASITRLSLKSAYWVSIAINFAILAILVVLISKSKLPAMFRTRTGEIQRGIAEARKASEDANRRLADIEKRLSRLDAEVAGMRSEAEKEAAAEEERIARAAEEDRVKIVRAAEAEIAAAAKLAKRELQGYSADLAVSLAEKRIKVDADTDRALVSNFVEQLGDAGTSGKDGGK